MFKITSFYIHKMEDFEPINSLLFYQWKGSCHQELVPIHKEVLLKFLYIYGYEDTVKIPKVQKLMLET